MFALGIGVQTCALPISGLVDAQRPLDFAPARLEHRPPILVTVRNQPMGRYGGDRLVPVLHLDRVQGDVDHITVGIKLRHFDPVADPQHVVRGELDRGDEREDRVLRSEEHTSELQSLMRISYAVFCLKKKNKTTPKVKTTNIPYQPTSSHNYRTTINQT